jgi:hypothetical protein
VRKQTVGWIVAAGLLFTGTLAAEPLEDLRARLAGMRNDQPTRVKVDVEVRHRGSAPLHLNRDKKHGRAEIAFSPDRGVKMLEQRWTGTGSRFSIWRKSKDDGESRVLDFVEAEDLVNPAALMDVYLDGATLLKDEEASWQGQPARLLVFRPGPLSPQGKDEAEVSARAERLPYAFEVKVWLDETGAPLAMERSFETRLGPALDATQLQSLTFQQVGGRLLVAEARQSYSGTALAVLRSRDTKKIKVTEIH